MMEPYIDRLKDGDTAPFALSASPVSVPLIPLEEPSVMGDSFSLQPDAISWQTLRVKLM